jgi:hypothetical protein
MDNEAKPNTVSGIRTHDLRGKKLRLDAMQCDAYQEEVGHHGVEVVGVLHSFEVAVPAANQSSILMKIAWPSFMHIG